MAAHTKDYPLTKFYFNVDWGDGEMSFQEVTGLEMTREKAEYRGGLEPGFVKRQIPAMKSFGELTLKRGTFTGDNGFFDWWDGTAEDPMPERKQITITLRNNAGKPVFKWAVTNAFPTKLTSTDLNAENNEVAVEQLTLAHEGIKQEAVE